MIIYSENISPRLTYTLNHIFWHRFGINFHVTKNPIEFKNALGAKINYSNKKFDQAIQIVPQGLLFETHINNEKPLIEHQEKFPVLFPTIADDIGFDIFSSVFWLLSRYEEYQEHNTDAYNRFPAIESFAFKNGFLDLPVVDAWINYLGNLIHEKFSDIELREFMFKNITTIDVDSPWCYKNKGFLRNFAGLLRDSISLNIYNVKLRLSVLLNIMPDPWFKFDWLTEQAAAMEKRLLFFIHVGDYGKYDKTTKYSGRSFSNFINSISNKADIGLHPSFKAALNKNRFAAEIKRLEALLNKKIQKSRQHFLVFSINEYYKLLMELGISEDYTMGFADKPGFRAGTSNSFYFYDLFDNQETKLLIHPFAVMDRTLNSYENKSVETAIDTINKLAKNVKQVEGTFISLWHNESLSDNFEWKGWLEVFMNSIRIK